MNKLEAIDSMNVVTPKKEYGKCTTCPCPEACDDLNVCDNAMLACH